MISIIEFQDIDKISIYRPSSSAYTGALNMLWYNAQTWKAYGTSKAICAASPMRLCSGVAFKSLSSCDRAEWAVLHIWLTASIAEKEQSPGGTQGQQQLIVNHFFFSFLLHFYIKTQRISTNKRQTIVKCLQD